MNLLLVFEIYSVIIDIPNITDSVPKLIARLGN